MAEFRVVIDGLELDDQLRDTINESIQRVVLDHLAGVDLTVGRKHRGLVAYRPRPEWYGLVAQVVALKELEKIAGVGALKEQIR